MSVSIKNNDRVWSFDVFDTVLTRKVGAPRSVFILLGLLARNKGYITMTAGDFASERALAELQARRRLHYEVTLQDIYKQLSRNISLSEQDSSELMNTEMLLETRLIEPIPEICEQIKQLKNAGQNIIFVSDMYLSAEFIKQQLRHNGVTDGNEPVYVSCDHKKSKRCGSLFKHVLTAEKLNPRRIVHRGNSFADDVKMPNRLNITTMPYYQANLNRYEKILESYADATEGLSSLMAGASRKVRLSSNYSSDRNNVLRDVAAGVAGPVLAGYVLWILQNAVRNGYERLYFLSRDGQILSQVAKRLAKKLGYNIEFRYLYGSRQAWHIASVANITKQEQEWIFRVTDIYTIEQILNRVCMKPSEIRDVLEKLGFTEESWARQLTWFERKRIRGLAENVEFVNKVIKKANERRTILLDYLKQEGIADSAKSALVDLGWGGRMRNSLCAVLGNLGRAPIDGFYFGLSSGNANGNNGARLAYFLDTRAGRSCTDPIPKIATIMEMFCAANHGQTVGYECRDNLIVPVFDNTHANAVVNWGVKTVQKSICNFIDNIDFSVSCASSFQNLLPCSHELLKAFWLKPATAEAAVWGEFPFEDEQTGGHYFQLASAYTASDIKKVFLNGALDKHSCQWVVGSLILSSFVNRLACAIAAKLGRILRETVKLFIRR